MLKKRRETIRGCGSTARVKLKMNRLTGAMLVGSTVFLCAGETVHEEIPMTAPLVEKSPSSGICDFYKNLGKVYVNEENPWLQELSFFGRFQYQYANVDGTDIAGNDFDYDTDEVRRFYAGAKLRFLRYFELSGQANIYDDDGPVNGEEGFDFEHLWDGFLRFDAGKAFGLNAVDGLKLGYGAREVNMSAEYNISSKNIKTAERSAISNKIWAHDTEFSNPTGAWLELMTGNLETQLGVFTTTQDDWIANWNDGELYYLKMKYDYSKAVDSKVGQLLWTAFYQDADITGDRLASGVEWATSLSTTYGRDNWQFILEGIYGNNGDQSRADREGDFWAIVFLPSLWLVQDRLELVARYQYQGSEEEQGSRLYSRYSRRAETVGAANLNGGWGDSHHSYYAGLNYYLCGDNAKFMAGVQYDDMNRDKVDVYEGWTTFFGFRTFL